MRGNSPLGTLNSQRAILSRPKHPLGLTNSSETLLKPFPSPPSLTISGPQTIHISRKKRRAFYRFYDFSISSLSCMPIMNTRLQYPKYGSQQHTDNIPSRQTNQEIGYRKDYIVHYPGSPNNSPTPDPDRRPGRPDEKE
jgi:hypothetical protein